MPGLCRYRLPTERVDSDFGFLSRARQLVIPLWFSKYHSLGRTEYEVCRPVCCVELAMLTCKVAIQRARLDKSSWAMMRWRGYCDRIEKPIPNRCHWFLVICDGVMEKR